MCEYYVYIMTSKGNGALYIGITKDLAKRIVRHRTGKGSKFAERYNLDRLVYYEKVNGCREARSRERQLKWWKRKWKIALMEKMNPGHKDISEEIVYPR
ncbi:MAG: GIY-YIG nuclease family protein [Sedimentisphaerales bacterium]|nr:GIY-YIG nuclease family protein [Sedimentisphaerales bacterium]